MNNPAKNCARFTKTFRLEYGIPPKIARSPGRDDRSFGAALEKDRLSAWASTVCKSAECIRVFRRESNEHVVQTYPSEFKQFLVAGCVASTNLHGQAPS